MYRRDIPDNDHAYITWEPDDEDAAAQALAEIDGTGVNLPQQAKDQAQIDGTGVNLPQQAKDQAQIDLVARVGNAREAEAVAMSVTERYEELTQNNG